MTPEDLKKTPMFQAIEFMYSREAKQDILRDNMDMLFEGLEKYVKNLENMAGYYNGNCTEPNNSLYSQGKADAYGDAVIMLKDMLREITG